LNPDTTSPSDAGSGVVCALGEDAEALFRQLIDDHQQRLYRFVVKHIGWGSDAEDLTQQAFVEAAQGYATFRGASELSTWLYGIAMNLVRNYLSRAPHRRFAFEDDEVLADTRSDSPDPSEQLAQTQMIRALQKELSYEDAAVMLSIPVGTVRSRVSRARSTLRKRLSASRHELGF
jgi:DNA-directed RNA polymerase specialized sigma24 family protein